MKDGRAWIGNRTKFVRWRLAGPVRLLDPSWCELAKGFQRVNQLESRLREEWEEPVEQARRRRLEEARTERQSELQAARKRLRIFLLLGPVLALVLLALLFGLVKPDFASGAILCSLLALSGAAAPALFTVARLRLIRRREPYIPEVNLDIGRRWWQEVCRSGPLELEKEGDAGELGFLLRIRSELPDEYLGVKGLLVQKSLDADLIVVGPTGIWVFEVKHWTGTIILRDGWWRRIKHYYAQGGRLAFEERDIQRPFDGQWLRQKKAVEETLRRGVPSRSRLPSLIRGGLVFTHPEVVLDIDASCRAEYGDPEHWVNSVLRAKETLEFSVESRLEVIDALVKWAGHVSREGAPEKSAARLADDLFESAVASARSRVDGAYPPQSSGG